MNPFSSLPLFRVAPRAPLALALALAGCALAPDYRPPLADAPAAYKEAKPIPDTWKAAAPAEAQARGEWWRVFGDPLLDDLEQRAAAANQDLRAGLARLDQTRALQATARSELYPQVGIGAAATRQRPSPALQGLPAEADTQFSTLWRAQANIAYEADLFGRVRSGVAAADAGFQQREALFHSLQLAIQADVAQAYFTLRELDSLGMLYAETVSLRQRGLALLQRRLAAGDIGELEVARANAELASARAEAAGIARQRAVAEHALAILVGEQPAAFGLPPQALARSMPRIPAGLPSALLERRPDIAAAERAMAAANARIGAARAAFFPRLSLTGNLGYESAELGDLFKWGSRAFVVGPLAGTLLSLPIFDGGARQAGVDQAQAVYAEEVANYRQAVLRAFQEVEDNLAHLRLLDGQIDAQGEAVQSSRRAAHFSARQYGEGMVSQLDVIDADRGVLQQQRAAVQLDADRARATVHLIRALGGSWSAAPT